MAYIVCTMSPGGETRQEIIDLAEDFWFDFVYFYREAVRQQRAEDALRERRFARAALTSFVRYISAMANRWMTCGGGSPGNKPPEEAHQDSAGRLACLASRHGAEPPPTDQVASLASLEKRLGSLRDEGEPELFERTKLDSLVGPVSDILGWLSDLQSKAGLPLPQNTGILGMAFAEKIGTPESSAESRLEYDEFPSDPAAWTTDPNEWDDYWKATHKHTG
jgi:hypothetical protein